MTNILTTDYIDIRDLLTYVDSAIDVLEDFDENPENYTPKEISDALEDIEIVRSVLRDLGYPTEEASDVEGAIERVMDRQGVTFIADSYFSEAIEEHLRGMGSMPNETNPHPWITVEIDEEAAKNDHTEITIAGKKYYFEKEG